MRPPDSAAPGLPAHSCATRSSPGCSRTAHGVFPGPCPRPPGRTRTRPSRGATVALSMCRGSATRVLAARAPDGCDHPRRGADASLRRSRSMSSRSSSRAASAPDAVGSIWSSFRSQASRRLEEQAAIWPRSHWRSLCICAMSTAHLSARLAAVDVAAQVSRPRRACPRPWFSLGGFCWVELPVGCVRLLLATPIGLVVATPVQIPALAHDSLRWAAIRKVPLRPAHNSPMLLKLP